MIYSRKVDWYLDDPGVYDRNLGLLLYGNPDGQKTPEECLDNGHTRTFIDTINLIHATTPAITLANSMNLITPINALWTNGGVITPNVIANQATNAPIPYNGNTALDRFIYLLKYEYRGMFQWAAGTSVAFRAWVANPNANAVIAPRSIINCWEIVFYAAIKANLVPRGTVANVYNNPLPGFSVQQALGVQSNAAGLGGVVQGTKTAPVVAPHVGDIIFEPDRDNATNEDTMHHVFVILALSADGDFQHHTAMNLWGSIAGGIPEPVKVGVIFGVNVNVYRAVRLG